ncbi:hypothetical protein BB8028_0006g00440 [Beauveria bassiana]|uniref:CRA-b-like protein n=1 Tax=Beauveria bassiana TaxID=176275 RepID=A0A2S7YIP3_BEABA|nr:hypothetical protein BB8028_0006g00440 [Beauveria bassiana]
MSLDLLGPLTTTWTAPATCSLLFAYPDRVGHMIAYRGERCDATAGARDGANCWPPRREGIPDKSSAMLGWGFYSPGLVCPDGYTTACTAIFGQRADWVTQFPLVAGETAVGCCPTGYECTNWNQFGNTCYATPKEMTVTTAVCGADGISSQGKYVFPATVSVGVSDGSSSTISMLWAPMFQLNFRQSDLSSHEATSSAPRTSKTPSPTSTSSQASEQAGATTSSSLSKGAIAGIAVGSVVAGLVVGAASIIVIFRHRRHRKVAQAAAAQNLLHEQAKPEMDGQGQNRAWYGQQAEPQEMQAPFPLSELPAHR